MEINLKRLILFAFCFSGMAALIYEVVWTRPLSLIFGSTIYAVSMMLSAFMAGLALGSYILSKYADRLKNPLYNFALLEVGIGIYGLLIIWLFNILPYPYLWIWNKFNLSFGVFSFVQFILCFLVLLVPTTLMGATWPVVNKAYIKHIDKIGRVTGSLYSVNTLGAIIGSWSAGFILIPLLGIKGSTIFAAVSNLIVGILIFFHFKSWEGRKKRKDTVFYGLIALFFIILLFSPNYNFSLLNTGIYFTQGNATIEDIKDAAAKTDALFAEEGLYGSVLVDSEKDTVVNVSYEGTDYKLEVNANSFFGDLKTLKINGKTQCGTGRLDTVTTSLLGGLPIILGKEGDVLNIGLGCGLTLGMLEKGNFENIDSMEVDPVVIEAAKEFNDIHNNALDDPRSNIIIDDARNYLLKTDKKYDVIVNEPSHPYSVSCSNLLTSEFFLLMKEHLREDGVVVQWAPIGQLKSCDTPGFAIFYKTFSSVFPYNYVFISKTKIPMIQPYFTKDSDGEVKAGYNEVYDYPNPRWKYGEAILIGSLKPINIEKYFDSFNVNGSEEGIIEYFGDIKIFDLRDYYVFSNEDVVGFSDDVELNTDDKPVIEFLAAKNLYLSKSPSQCKVQQGIEYLESYEKR